MWELEWKGLFLVLAPKDFANGEKGESRCCQIKRENLFLDLVSSAWGLSGRRMGFKRKEEIVLKISPLLFVSSAKNIVSHPAENLISRRRISRYHCMHITRVRKGNVS